MTVYQIFKQFIQLFCNLSLQFSNSHQITDFPQSSLLQIPNFLEQYFGHETGTEEDILSKYDSKFKTIQQHLLSSTNLFSQTHQNNIDIFTLSTLISKQSFTLQQSLQSILKNINCNINENLNIFDQI
jgi:hypothetical protein